MGSKNSKIPKPKLSNENSASTFPYVRGSKDARARSQQISRDLKKAFSEDAQIVKILLLGAGESGKSTIVKQMKLLHPVNKRLESGFDVKDKTEARRAIYANIIDSIVSLSNAVEDLKIVMSQNDDKNKINESKSIVFQYFQKLPQSHEKDNRRNCHSMDELSEKESIKPHQRQMSTDGFGSPSHGLENENCCPPTEVIQALRYLWSAPSIRKAYERRNEFQLIDSASYFLNDLDRVCTPEYEPSDDDILRTRVRTTGIVKIEFEFRHLTFNMFDVGGQRSERKKWIHCFDNVTAVLFVVSMSEYDQVLAEDNRVNRMVESLKLFEETVNGIHLCRKPFIIFFNKRDLFEEKVLRKSIHCAFPDYSGEPYSVHDSSDFIVERYLGQSKASAGKRAMYPHLVTATDTQLVKFVFSGVAEIILNDILRETGLN